MHSAAHQRAPHRFRRLGNHQEPRLAICEARDRKGLYATARAGLIPEFTGVSDSYEVPEHPELAIDTTELGIEEAVQQVLLKLEHEGYLR